MTKGSDASLGREPIRHRETRRRGRVQTIGEAVAQASPGEGSSRFHPGRGETTPGLAIELPVAVAQRLQRTHRMVSHSL